jgi:hypothetical protein
MPKAFPLAHDAGHGPGTRRGDGTDKKCTERLPPGAFEDSLSVARAAYLLVSRSWARRWRAATTRARRDRRTFKRVADQSMDSACGADEVGFGCCEPQRLGAARETTASRRHAWLGIALGGNSKYL